MSEQNQRPRFPMTEIANDEDLRRGLEHTLQRQGYRFNTKYPCPGGH